MICIFCDSENVELVDTHEIPPSPTRKTTIVVNIYQCNDCGRRFRKGKQQAEQEEEQEEQQERLEGIS